MPIVEQAKIFSEISRLYYEVVPEKYNTYCILTSQIMQDVLRHFDIPSYLIPCQLWCATDTSNYVVGLFTAPRDKKWDGHIVCGTNNVIFDAAVSHFRREFSIDTPAFVMANRFRIPTYTIARVDLHDSQRLWWQDAPTVAGRYPVLEDMRIVKELAGELIVQVERAL